MEIRKTKPEELEVLLKMYEHARTFMATHGNASQWGNTYPSPQLILDDITEGNSYVCTEQDQIIATFYYKEGADGRDTEHRRGQRNLYLLRTGQYIIPELQLQTRIYRDNAAQLHVSQYGTCNHL